MYGRMRMHMPVKNSNAGYHQSHGTNSKHF